MEKEKIINYLKENDLTEVELLKEQQDLFVTRFYYDFDEAELKAAKAYADDEGGNDKDDNWYEEYYMPYLTEIAVDNVGDIIEEIMSNMNVKAQFISYEMEEEDDYSEFIAIFYKENDGLDIEDELMKLNL